MCCQSSHSSVAFRLYVTLGSVNPMYVADSAHAPLIDALPKGSWHDLRQQEDPELQRLADSLIGTALGGKASSTIMKYLGGFGRWKAWALDHKLQVFPANESHVVYLQHLGETKQSKAAVEEAVNSLAWVHSLSGLPSPTKSPLVQIVHEDLRRSLAKPLRKKEPFTLEMLKAISINAEKGNSLKKEN